MSAPPTPTVELPTSTARAERANCAGMKSTARKVSRRNASVVSVACYFAPSRRGGGAVTVAISNSFTHTHTHARTHAHTHTFNGPLSGTTQVSRYQKGKTNLDFTEARDLGGSGISRAICKSSPHTRQITTPAPLHSYVFYGPDALPAAQPTASKH